MQKIKMMVAAACLCAGMAALGVEFSLGVGAYEGRAAFKAWSRSNASVRESSMIFSTTAPCSCRTRDPAPALT